MAASDSTGPKGSGFAFLLNRFAETLDALGELLEAATPLVQDLDSPERRLSDATEALKNITSADARELSRVVLDHQERLSEAMKAIGERESSNDIEGTEDREQPANYKISDLLKAIVEKFPGRPWIGQFVSAIVRHSIRPFTTPILHQAIIIAGVSAFENLVSGTVLQFFEFRPQALGAGRLDQEKEFSLADLREIGDIEEASRLAVTRRVEDLMWQGFDDWAGWFSSHIKIDWSEIALDWDGTRELFERRHLLAHNAGQVNRRYLARVDFDGPTPEIGTVLPLDESYVRTALDHLLVLGALLTSGTWARTLKEESDTAASRLSDVVYDLMQADRWEATRRVCEVGKTMDCADRLQAVFQVNEWLSVKRLGRMDEIRDEIEAWDTSALAGPFRLARVALLDDLEAALHILEQSLASEEVMPGDAYGWPLLAEIREVPKFADIMLPYGSQDEAAQRGRQPLKRVRISESGEAFHRPSCRSAGPKGRLVPRRKAEEQGLRPCAVCKP